MGNKKLQVWLPLLFAMVMVLGMVIGYQLKDKTIGNRFFRLGRRSSLQELVDLVKEKYVDMVGSDSLTKMAADDLLGHLDPHSLYIPADDLKEVNEELMGNFQGIGIEFQIMDDTLNVMHIIPGGPSEKAGLQVGDKFLAMNDSVKLAGRHLSSEDIRKMLRGPMNTTVKLTYLRDGTSRQVSITRGLIPVSPIDAAYMIEPHTGYLRINKFAERTYEAFMQAMEKLKAQGMQKLVLDLRGNGGGLMKEATDIADEFLSGDKLIVYTEGAHVPRLEYRCKRDGIFENGPLAVLIDEGTASASEVLTGALQDWDRATIIGRRSFGKGLVQQQFQLTDGSAVRLTIARYFTPLGRNIQKSYSAGKEEYEKELADRFHDGEVVKEDTSRHGSKAYKTPAGRVVYGGGGITPDDFVPFDTSYMSPTLMSLTYKGTLSDFVYRYYLQNKTRFSQVSSPAKLATVFAPGEPEWHALENFARADSIRIDRVSSREKTDILQRVAALMGRQIWRMEGYFEVSNQYDATVQEALRKLR